VRICTYTPIQNKLGRLDVRLYECVLVKSAPIKLTKKDTVFRLFSKDDEA